MRQAIHPVGARVAVLASLTGCALACGSLAVACGGTETHLGDTGDGGGSGGDAASEASGPATDGGPGAMPDGTIGPGSDGASGDDGSPFLDAGTPAVDAATPGCAPPGDPSKAALCLHLAPEAIAFTSDPKFDGKGYVVAEVFDTPHPDADGGSVPALATTLLPSGAPATTLDLAQGVPVARFDGVPSTVYVRAIFVDDPALKPSLGAGVWIAGYDLADGIKSGLPLLPHPLTLGAGNDLTLDLVALREMTITVNRTATPAGNGQGPASTVAVVDQSPTSSSAVFGTGNSGCVRVDGANTAQIPGFVIGKGPYYVAAVIDDFAAPDAGTGAGLPLGSLTSLEHVDAGYDIPAADRLTYPADAYRVSFTVSLGLTLPATAGMVDPSTCP
jgi:hypothetical protein